MSDLLVLGIGNVLLRDEGVGVHVVQALTQDAAQLPSGTRLVDGGTLGLDLLPLLEDAKGVVFVDAVNLGEAPGAVRVLQDKELETAIGQHLSPHQIGMADLLAVARLTGVLPERVALVGIQPGPIEDGLELSASVQRAVPLAARTVTEEVWNLRRRLERD